jgi:tryptophan synthase alpha chain
MNRIDEKFEELAERGEKGFVAYITAGDPDLDRTHDIVLALADAGADVVELGLPFSDPLADGPTNAEAAYRALQSGTTIRGVLECVKRIRQSCRIPIVIYTYCNPLWQYGFQKFHRDCEDAGVDGLLMLELPLEESAHDPELNFDHNLRWIRLIAPTTPPERMKKIAAAGEGFLYYISREGVTGEQTELSDSIGEQVALIRQASDTPVAVGFGISTPEQAAEVAKSADAVVVGSAIVRRIHENRDDPEMPRIIGDFVRPLASAAHGR